MRPDAGGDQLREAAAVHCESAAGGDAGGICALQNQGTPEGQLGLQNPRGALLSLAAEGVAARPLDMPVAIDVVSAT
jgi:hypothetical protein